MHVCVESARCVFTQKIVEYLNIRSKKWAWLEAWPPHAHPVEVLDDAPREIPLELDGYLYQPVEVVCTDAKQLQHPGEDPGGRETIIDPSIHSQYINYTLITHVYM